MLRMTRAEPFDGRLPLQPPCPRRVIALFIEGMYTGLMSVVHFGGSAMNTYSWAYFLLPLPAILMSGIAYIIGRYELHLTKLMLPLTPEEIEKKQEKKANRRSSSEK